jgi:large subunit ribosomal protein L29
MKRKEELKSIKEMSLDQAKEELANAEKEILNLKFRKALNGIPKSSELSRLRKRIAKIETVLREKVILA